MIESSILILAKNEEENIEACLRSVFAQVGTGRYEVILIDSGSSDRTVEIASKFPIKLYQIPAEEFHHARTRNYAATLASGKFLVYLAADAIPTSEEWLKSLLAGFEHSTVGAVYGRHLPKCGSSFEREDALNAIYGPERIIKSQSTRQKLGFRYYHMSTVNAAIRKDVWQATPFPEELKVFEDLGIAKRILEADWKILYEPAASVHHSHDHTTSGLLKRYFDIGYTLRRLEAWNAEVRTSMARDAWTLLSRKLGRLNGNGKSRAVTLSVTQDIAKSVGIFLGLHENYLPLILKRRLSAFRVYD